MDKRIITDIDKLPSAAAVTLAKNIHDELDKHYPNQLWAVNVNEEGGIVDVYAMRCSTRHGFRMKIAQIPGDFRNIVAAGGELLERFGQSRRLTGHFDPTARPRDLAGNMIGYE